jgi:hypothetical protein
MTGKPAAVAQAFFEVDTSEEAFRTLRQLLQTPEARVGELEGKARATAPPQPVRGRRKRARSS